jgi:hypothetical protein
LRPSQYAYQRSVLGSVRTGPSVRIHQAHHLLLHPETRKLAACCRMRTELPDKPMSTRPPDR